MAEQSLAHGLWGLAAHRNCPASGGGVGGQGGTTADVDAPVLDLALEAQLRAMVPLASRLADNGHSTVTIATTWRAA